MRDRARAAFGRVPRPSRGRDRRPMIYFIVQRWHDYTLRNFLDAWGQSVRKKIKILDYVDVASARWLPFGTYVFTDHDRLSEPQTALAAAMADQLLAAGPA